MSRIGILYSQESGIILRIINPDNDTHLDWLDANKAEGTVLLTVEKELVGATIDLTPNADFLIKYFMNNGGLELSYGKSCAILNENNEIIDVVQACPKLLKKRFDEDFLKGLPRRDIVSASGGEIGDIYNEDTKEFSEKKKVIN